jgi:hypothetical protein
MGKSMRCWGSEAISDVRMGALHASVLVSRRAGSA